MPPFVGVAVNVIEVPAQAGLVPVVKAIEIVGVTGVLMVAVMPLDVACVGLAQLALDVRIQVTI